METITKDCRTCKYGYTCSRPDREARADCSRDNNYEHYEHGDPNERLLKLQRDGTINIVIGGQGEHEVNANWSIDKAYKELARTSEYCGGLTTKESGITLHVAKSDGLWQLEWMHGKLYKISKVNHKEWWKAYD